MKFSGSILGMKVSVNIEKNNSISIFGNSAAGYSGPYNREKDGSYSSPELNRFKRDISNVNIKEGIYTVISEFWSPSIGGGGNIWRVGEKLKIKDGLIIRTYGNGNENKDYYGMIHNPKYLLK